MSDNNENNVNEIKEEEVSKDTKDTKKTGGSRSIMAKIVLAVAVIVFIVSAVMLIKYFIEYKAASNEYEDLASEYVKVDKDGKPEVDLDKLKAVNEDVVGWIRFENIDIDYPIVQGKDNDYYLSHTFKKEVNRSASIFMDYQNKRDFSDQNTIIYGHNMKDKSMFALLNEFANEQYFKDNPGFYIFDFTGCHYYKIFSCYRCNVEPASVNNNSQEHHYTLSFKNEKSFQQHIDEVKKCSLYDTGVTPTTNDKLIMLSTCTSNDNYRFVVHAVKVV